MLCASYQPPPPPVPPLTGLDGKVKIWDVFGNKKCMRTYLGHSKGVKDINFTNDGSKFVSVGYDKNIRLWDTETGQVCAEYGDVCPAAVPQLRVPCRREEGLDSGSLLRAWLSRHSCKFGFEWRPLRHVLVCCVYIPC